MRQDEDCSPPRTGANPLYRGALLNRWDEALRRGVPGLFVGAPGGFGKTVALAQWLHGRRSGVGWLTLDEHHDHEPRLVSGLLRALAFAQRRNRRLAALARREGPFSEEDLFDALDRVVLDGERTHLLVLDDLHCLADPKTIRLLLRFLKRLPRSFAVCLAGRALPDPLDELVLKGDLEVTPASALAFTLEEVEALLRRQKGRRPGDAEALFARTGGWPMAVAAFLRGDRPDEVEDRRNQDLLFSYLETHVWGFLDEDAREVLLRASLAPSLTPRRCRCLTGRADSEALLDRLYRENLFLARSQDGTYRFHDLFRGFLNRKLEERLEPEERAALLRALARCLFEEGEIYEAASLYARCGDGESLSACCAALRHYSPQHPLEERIAFTRRILQDIPSSGEPHPSVAVQGALIRYLEGDMEGFEALLDRIPAASLRGDPQTLSLWRILELLDRRRPLGPLLEELLALPEEDPLDPGGNTRGIPPGTLTAYLPLMHRSFPDRADRFLRMEVFPETFCRACRPLLGDDVDLMALCMTAGGLYEQNRLEEACALAAQAAAQASGKREDLRFCADMLFLSVLVARGRTDEARRLEAEIARRIEEGNLRALGPNFQAWVARGRLLENQRETAAEWLQRHAAPLTEPPAFHRIYQHFVTLRALLAEGSLDLALLWGEKLLGLAEAYRRPLDQLEARILLAQVQWRRGQRSRALDLLGRALEEAAPRGLTRAFLDEAPNLRPLLEGFHRTRRGGDPSFRRFAVQVHLLVQEAAASLQDPLPREAPPIPLTPRQEEILRLLGENAPYQRIAERLGVSHSTAKYHVLKLYRTLGVGSAEEALRKARRP